MDGLTRDAIGRGLLQLWQPARGYRFNTDSVLLGAMGAHHAARAGGLTVDCGAGCGVAGLWCAAVARGPVLLVERQAQMAQLCARNAAEHGLHQVMTLQGDFRALPLAAGSVQTLLCNPPYRPADAGRLSPLPQRRASNHTLFGGMAEVLVEAARVLRPNGVAVVVGPVELVDAQAPLGLHRIRRLALVTRGTQPQRALAAFSPAHAPDSNETRRLQDEGGRFEPWVADILENRVPLLA